MSTRKFPIILKTSISLRDKALHLKTVNIYSNWTRESRERSILCFLFSLFFLLPCRSSNSWCELSMMDYGGTGQFTNCYWEYLSYLDTNNQLTSTHRTYISHYWGKKLQTLDNVLWGMIKDLFKNKNLKNWQQFAASYFLGGKTRKKKLFSQLGTCFAGIRL